MCCRLLVLRFSLAASCFLISDSKGVSLACGDLVGWSDVAESGVGAHSVVMVDAGTDGAIAVLESERGFGRTASALIGMRWNLSSLPLL